MKHSFEQLIEDLRPAMREWLIAFYVSDTMMTIRLPKDASRRIQLTKHINEHYNVKVQLHGTFSIHVHKK